MSGLRSGMEDWSLQFLRAVSKVTNASLPLVFKKKKKERKADPISRESGIVFAFPESEEPQVGRQDLSTPGLDKDAET